ISSSSWAVRVSDFGLMSTSYLVLFCRCQGQKTGTKVLRGSARFWRREPRRTLQNLVEPELTSFFDVYEVGLDHDQIALSRLANDAKKVVHLDHFLQLLIDEPLKEIAGQVIILFDGEIHQRRDLTRDLLLPLQRRFNRGLRRAKRRCRRGDRRNPQIPFRVEHVLDELHRVLLFFFGLIKKQLRQQLQLTLLEVAGDAEILQAGTEFMADLLVECLGESWTN